MIYKNQIKKIYTIIISLIMINLFILSCTITISRLRDYINRSTRVYYGKDEYPFENRDEKDIYNTQADNLIFIQDKMDKALTTEPAFWLSDFLTIHFDFLKVCGMDAVLAQFSSGRSVYDTAIGLNDNMFVGVLKKNTDKVECYVNELTLFGVKMKEQGKNFVYFSSPHKEMEFSDPFYKKYYPNDINEIENTIMNNLQNKDLDTISGKDFLYKQGYRLEDVFFKTDHHWRPQGGILACEELVKYLNKKCGYTIDSSLFSQERYHVDVIKDAWLGSQGRKVSLTYADPEDFFIVIPDYITDYQVFYSEKNETLYGSIQDTLLDWENYYQYGIDDYGTDMYKSYAYGDQGLIQIHNNLISDNSKVLILKCSMANVVVPYFAAAVENLDVIDLRYFDGSLQTYIKETDPDTVIVMYSSACFSESDSSNQYLFDFR